MVRKIDAHHHFWRTERGDYHWMPPSGPLHRDYLPDDLTPLLETARIDGTILVQAAQTLAETQFLLELAHQPDSKVLGVTGWVPLDSDQAPAQLEQFASQPKAVAIRPMLHDLSDAAWITQPQVIKNLCLLPSLGLCFEVLSYPVHLPYVLQAIDQVPNLAVVIDHLSKPEYGPIPHEDWRHWMTEFARRPHTYCKLSGMVTEIGTSWTIDDLRSHVDFILEAFGSERVMFGSDWPVCLQVASYAQVVATAETFTAQLSENEQAQVWGETATRFYNL